jgi:hypothetical protein
MGAAVEHLNTAVLITMHVTHLRTSSTHQKATHVPGARSTDGTGAAAAAAAAARPAVLVLRLLLLMMMMMTMTAVVMMMMMMMMWRCRHPRQL